MTTPHPTATKLMLFRHAETPSTQSQPFGITADGQQDDESLIIHGWQRAGAFVSFFISPKTPHRSLPVYLRHQDKIVTYPTRPHSKSAILESEW